MCNFRGRLHQVKKNNKKTNKKNCPVIKQFAVVHLSASRGRREPHNQLVYAAKTTGK